MWGSLRYTLCGFGLLVSTIVGHEHGDNPFESPLFEYSGGWPAFGSLMEMFNEYEADEEHRHEDHFGHKVTVATYRATIGNPPNSGAAVYDAGFYCHFLSKIHQGTYSNDALTNQLHEYFINVRCDDNPVGLENRILTDMSVEDRFANPDYIKTAFSFKSMLPFGAPDQIEERCAQTLLEYDDINSLLDPPMLMHSRTPNINVDDIDGSNALNDRSIGCIKDGAHTYDYGLPDTNTTLDLWTQPRKIKAPDGSGSGAGVMFQVYYAVKDALRLYDRNTEQIRYTVDICKDLQNANGGFYRFCDGVTPNMNWYDPDSPFKGAFRAVHFKRFAIDDNSSSRPEAFCTNSFGRETTSANSNGECPAGFVVQKLKPFDGKNNWNYFTNPVTDVSGGITGSLYVLGQDVKYPAKTATNPNNSSPNHRWFELISGTADAPGAPDHSGLIKPFDTSTWPVEMLLLAGDNCPLGDISAAHPDEAFCPVGIGFEKLIDQRDVIPAAIRDAVAPGMNTAVHGPN